MQLLKFYLVGFLNGVFNRFTCWSSYGYVSSIGNLRGYAGGVAFPKIYARDINASLCEFPSVASGLAGAVFCSACIKSFPEWILASMYEIFGMLNFLGGNILCLISVMIFFLVFMPYVICSALWLFRCTSWILH